MRRPCDRSRAAFAFLLSRSLGPALVAPLETATGVKAFCVDKPSPVMTRAAQGTGHEDRPDDADRRTMETDIRGGVQLDFCSAAVPSGGTKSQDLPRCACRPDTVAASVAEFANPLDAHDWHPPWRTARTRVPAQARPISSRPAPQRTIICPPCLVSSHLAHRGARAWHRAAAQLPVAIDILAFV
ncbi:MAG: HAD hydrolase-like protein [Gemmata sp.]